jgi:RNA polymerase sigma-70 factor, ECF subfamily
LTDFRETLATHRPDLLRHCYRMLGSFADAEDIVQDVLLNAWKARDTYAGEAPPGHWLMRIATNTCLNELARRRRRGLPQLEREPSTGIAPIEEREAADWVTPAPDTQLFGPPAGVLEARESVALAFLALLQRLPPRQRAVLLLKDVVGWTAEEIASALELSLGSVNSALHRARQTIATRPAPASGAPSPDVLRAYIRSWEAHDIDSLVALLRDDVVFAMPPHATWFHGASAVEQFLRGPAFSARWSAGFRVVETRANGVPALAFYRHTDAGYQRSSLQLVCFVEGKVAEVISFIGAGYFRGFVLPERLDEAPP